MGDTMDIKERLRPYLPYIILFLLALAAHGSVSYSRDDVLFRAALDGSDGWTFLAERYQTWSSRSVIEGVMIYILDIDSFPLWKILNCLMFLPLLYGLVRLIRENGLSERAGTSGNSLLWFLLGLVLLYPYGYDMSTSGWAATTMNYFWPLVFALIALIPIRKILCGEKIRWFAWPFYLAAFLYAANAEQTCVILLAVYAVFFIWQLTEKKFQPLFLAGLILGLCSLAWILLCPGNQLRTASEMSRFVDYPMLGLADKLDLGFSSAVTQLIGSPNMLFLLFSLMLAAAVWRKYPVVLFRLAASVPAAAALVFGMFGREMTQLYPELASLIQITDYGVITPENYYQYKSYLPLIVMGMIVVCILISIYLIYEDQPRLGLLSAFIFLLGLGSRAMMAFSPTVWASNTRTNIYLDFSMILVCGLLYQKNVWSWRQRLTLEWGVGLMAVFSYGIQFAAMY